MPTVSVVIPCYKYGQYVTGCVRSLLSNTEVDLDILVVDDASPDDSWSVVQKLPEIDPRIRVQRNEKNTGLIGTANAGIMAAKGDYVVLLSADDALAPGWLDRGVAELERHPKAAFAYGPTRRFSGPLPKLHVKRKAEVRYSTGREWMGRGCAVAGAYLLSPEVIVRTSVHHEVGGYLPELPYSSDMEMWMRLATVGDVIRVDGPVAAFYRVSPQSMSRGIYTNLLRGLEARRDAFEAWYRFADGRVADRDELMAAVRRSLARRAVRRAYQAFLQDPHGELFEQLCRFALDNDAAWAGPQIERVKGWRDKRFAMGVRRAVLPVTRAGVRARGAATDIRAKLHIV